MDNNGEDRRESARRRISSLSGVEMSAKIYNILPNLTTLLKKRGTFKKP